jgi:hypothetical protein
MRLVISYQALMLSLSKHGPEGAKPRLSFSE